MKNVLLILLLFAALVAPAQDKNPSDVLIPLPVAAFFLEQNEKAKLLQVQVDSLHYDIYLLEKRDSIRKQQLQLEQDKQVQYDSLLELQRGEIEGCHVSEAALAKDLKKEKRKSKVVIALAIAFGIAVSIF